MSGTAVLLTVERGGVVQRVEGSRVVFSAHQCFAFDDDKRAAWLDALGSHLSGLDGLAVYGDGPLLAALLERVPGLRRQIIAVVVDPELGCGDGGLMVPAVQPHDVPDSVSNIFLCETLTLARMRMRKRLKGRANVCDADVLVNVAPHSIPARAWMPIEKNIYPIDVPEIEFPLGLDFLIIDCPSRNLALMPNGLGYLANALKQTSIKWQVFDLDVVAYHRYHITRLFDLGGKVVLDSGRVLPNDPWLAEHYDVWSTGSETAAGRSGNADVLDFFRPLIDETVSAIVAAKPKILGLSIQQCNEGISREVVRGVKARLPETVIVVGGYSCYNADVGLRAFPDCDYMCVGEAELTVGPLVESLARGERPTDQPGVLSRYDTPNRRYVPGPMPHNLDKIEFPKYEWFDLDLYRNYNGYQLTPIIASRGCRWSRCTFCAERFYWRIRSAKNFADELQWLVDRGCELYMFNESDLNGMPDKLLDICDEIIRRGLHKKVKLTGQLRIQKKSNRAFFDKLRAAGFVALRFGVDAFSANTIRLQKKGYTPDMVTQNLKDCWEAGIYTEVNWVIGVPGETDRDVEEGIQLILKNSPYIGRLANINPLILVNGSVYWIDPEAHNIRFREPRDELYRKFPRALPADSWYSVNPYIDAHVRKERFERIVIALHEAGFPVGEWAQKVIDDVQAARDPNRAATAKRADPAVVATEKADGLAETQPRARKTIPIGEKHDHEACEVDEETAPTETGPARLVRELETHRIYHYNGWFYGVPVVRGEVDLRGLDADGMQGIVRESTEQGVITLIESAARWANSRGHFEDQERQKARGSYFRANSLIGESRTAPTLDSDIEILSFRGETFAVRRDALREAVRHYGLVSRKRLEIPFRADTLARRIAALLPSKLIEEVRRTVLMERMRVLETVPHKRASDLAVLQLLLRGTLRRLSSAWRRPVRRKAVGEESQVLRVVSEGATPELMWTIGNFNVVKFDGVYFGLPHGLDIDWDSDVASLPGVISGKRSHEVTKEVERRTGVAQAQLIVADALQKASGPAGERSSIPRLLASVDGYNVVEYEGWIYGIPHSLGSVDLTEVDIMGMPGVIRDVSRDVVENEIADLRSIGKVAA